MGMFIEINKDLIPYSFNILLGGEVFVFDVGYNGTADMFTVSLKKDGETLCAGEPIVYGQTLFGDLFNRGGFPKVMIIPIDQSGEMEAVTFDNLNRTVFLKVYGEEGF